MSEELEMGATTGARERLASIINSARHDQHRANWWHELFQDLYAVPKQKQGEGAAPLLPLLVPGCADFASCGFSQLCVYFQGAVTAILLSNKNCKTRSWSSSQRERREGSQPIMWMKSKVSELGKRDGLP